MGSPSGLDTSRRKHTALVGSLGAQETPQQGLNLRLSFHHGPDNGLDELPVIPRPGLLQRSLYDLRLLTGPKPGGSGLVRESRMRGVAYPRSCVYELEKPMLRMLTHIRASNITDIGHLRACGHKYGQFPGPCGVPHCHWQGSCCKCDTPGLLGPGSIAPFYVGLDCSSALDLDTHVSKLEQPGFFGTLIPRAELHHKLLVPWTAVHRPSSSCTQVGRVSDDFFWLLSIAAQSTCRRSHCEFFPLSRSRAGWLISCSGSVGCSQGLSTTGSKMESSDCCSSLTHAKVRTPGSPGRAALSSSVWAWLLQGLQPLPNQPRPQSAWLHQGLF